MNHRPLATCRPALLACGLLLAACSGESPSGSAQPPPPATLMAEAAVTAPAGGWTLLPEDSRLSFVSIKNSAIAEVHRFTQLSGTVGADGKASVTVPLAGVATGIDLRDQRLRDLLFEVAKFPEATLSAQIDPQQVEALAPGAHAVLPVTVTLALHGQSNPMPVELRITRTDATHVLVTSERPVIVDTVNYGLIDGVDELRKVAGLQAIASAVPVTFSFRFAAGSGG